MKLLERAHLALESQKIPHALIGAAALATHGISRATLDLDLLAVSRRCLDRETWSDLATAGVEVDVRHGDADDPLAGVVRLEAPNERLVDVIVGRSRWQAAVISRARSSVIDAVEIRSRLRPTWCF